MSNDGEPLQPEATDDPLKVTFGVLAVVVVIAIPVTFGVVRYGAQGTLIWAAVVLSILAMLGAIVACVHLWLMAVRSGDASTRLQISLALFSGLIIGLAVWVPQRALEGQLDEVIEAAQRGNRESEPDQQFTNLSGEDLAGSSLSRTDFTGSDLSGSNLQGSALIASDFTEAQLEETDLTAANLDDATLVDAALNDARLDQARLTAADLSGADLEGASLVDAVLRDAELGGANLEGSDLSGADLEGANVSAAALNAALLNEDTRCPDGTNAELPKDPAEPAAGADTPAYECAEPESTFLLETEFEDGKPIPTRFTCDAETPVAPEFGWMGAPDGGEAVLALTRGDSTLWLVVLPHREARPLADVGGAATVVRDYMPPCPPAPEADSDGADVADESSTQTYSLRLFILSEPLPRDVEGNLLESGDQILERTIRDASDQAATTGQYTRKV